jgi:RNA recognition motif-containing protein
MSATAAHLLVQLVATTAHAAVHVVLLHLEAMVMQTGKVLTSSSQLGLIFLSGPAKSERGPAPQDDGAINPGSNLFVTGIHPRLSESDVTLLFEKYGDVEKCQIMLDPHTKESRGFGFVKMVTAEQADAAKEGLQAEVIEGRTLSIEKARRSRPRTPTPGKYFGPPKRGK